MSAEPWPTENALPLRITRQIDALCDEFEIALRSGSGVAIEPYLGRVEHPGAICSSKNWRCSHWGSCERKVLRILSRTCSK